MSEAQQAVLPAKLERAAWVKRVLKVELRQRAIGGAIDRQTVRAEPGEQPGEDGKSRTALVKRLAALNKKAIDFAGVAPRPQYSDVREKIRGIDTLITGAQWTDAHKAITAIERQIDEVGPACRKLRDLQTDVQRVTLKLDKGAGFLLPKDLDTYDKILLGLDQSTGLDAVDTAVETLKKAESDIDALIKAGEERVGRVKALQQKRALAQAAATRIEVKADELALTELHGRAKTLSGDLAKLADSTDETALSEALAKLEPLERDCAKPFAEAETRRRQGLLDDLRSRMEQLLEDKADSVDGAVPSLLEPVTEAQSELTERVEASPESDAVVQQAELAFDGLKSAIDDLEKEMLGIQPLQQQMRSRLEKYPAMLEKRNKAKKAKDDLDEAYDELPAELKDIDSDDWGKAEAWVDTGAWEPWTFMRLWAARLRDDAEALSEQDYTDAVAEKTKSFKTFLAIKLKAKPQFQKDGQDLLDAVDAILGPAAATETLTPDQKLAVDGLFKRIDTLVKDANKDILTKGTQAKKTDSDDGGHSISRHGPDISDNALRSRLKTGRAPDGVFSPATKSCRFNSYDDYTDTRVLAIDAIAVRAGLDLETMFGKNGEKAPTGYDWYDITLNHGPRVVGSGFRGTGTATAFPNGGQAYSASEALPPLTRTYTKISWDGGKSRWVAVQHFPTDV